MKKSKKIDKNYNSLYNRVIKLQDPGLQESLMKFIKLNPHFIKEVDRYFKDENGISYQIDLISKRLFIEYKYGEASGHTKQFYNQIRLAKLYNKTAVILAPNMKEEKFLKFKNKGFLIFRTEEDIINYERNGKNDCSITINK